jgi:hypothetical protein
MPKVTGAKKNGINPEASSELNFRSNLPVTQVLWQAGLRGI